MPANPLSFPPFHLDPDNACLWRGTRRLVLAPKDFAMLHYLVSHTGQLVTHEELLKAVWPDTIVSAKGLKAFVRRLRHVLHDRADKPRFIETVHGQGSCFLPAVTTAPAQRGAWSVKQALAPLSLSALRWTLYGLSVEKQNSRNCTDG